MTAGRTRATTTCVRSATTTGGATRTSGRCRVPVYSRRGTRSGRPRSSPRGRGRGAYIPHGSTRGADGEIGPDRQAGIEIRIRGFQIAEARAIGGVEGLGLVGGCGIAEAGCLAPPQPDVVEARRRGLARGEFVEEGGAAAVGGGGEGGCGGGAGIASAGGTGGGGCSGTAAGVAAAVAVGEVFGYTIGLVEVAGALAASRNAGIDLGAAGADIVDTFGWIAAYGKALGLDVGATLTFKQIMEFGIERDDVFENQTDCQEEEARCRKAVGSWEQIHSLVSVTQQEWSTRCNDGALCFQEAKQQRLRSPWKQSRT